ncbi:MAG: alpha/beta fold hydrolase [Candidatus Melainabacteria bacterium]|nr:alpha/beta fold hydrolase [Candidatus Melainabacteria bacterium]
MTTSFCFLYEISMRFACAFLFIFFLAIAPVVAADSSSDITDASCARVTIPVLYMTDRAASVKGTGYAAQRKIEDGNSIYHVNCGIAQYTLANSNSRALTDIQRKLGWLPAKSRTKLITKVLAGSGTSSAYRDFGQAIKDVAANTGHSEFFIIVHGYNTTFAQAAESAALLAYNLEKPVIVYDWPSKGKAGQYDVDAGNNEWSQEHFDQLVDQLAEVKASGIRFNLLAHSMGNRLAIRSAPVLRGKHLFDQIFLVDADFDAETFVHYMSRYARVTEENKHSDLAKGLNPPRVRILFSHRDHALPLSQFLYGGYTRLGQAADGMLTSVFTLSAFSRMLDHANNIIAGTSENPKVDLRPESMLKFEWIDFTALDYGIIGHTIPYKLIANLATSDRPGDGLELVDSDNGSVNKLSKFSLGLFHEKKRISTSIGQCKRVVVIKDKMASKDRVASTKIIAN